MFTRPSTYIGRPNDDDHGDGENQGNSKAIGSKVEQKFPTRSPPVKFRGDRRNV